METVQYVCIHVFYVHVMMYICENSMFLTFMSSQPCRDSLMEEPC